jgi:hypothetical protein
LLTIQEREHNPYCRLVVNLQPLFDGGKVLIEPGGGGQHERSGPVQRHLLAHRVDMCHGRKVLVGDQHGVTIVA